MKYHSKKLSEQIILITGASTGIGAALAERLAEKFPGIRLILAARNQEKLEQVANISREKGAEVFVIPTDLADGQQVDLLVQKALNHWGKIDILVNNAGYGQMGPMELIDPEAVKQQFDVNFHAPLRLSQALIPIMRNQGGGRMINISSLGGRMAFPAGGAYSCSKFALEALSDVLRMELKGFNIKVIVIEPGPVITEFFQVAREKLQQQISDPEKTPYRAAFEKVRDIEQQVAMLGWSAIKTADVIIKSMEDPRPKPRYLAATGGGILIFLMTKLLPTGISDLFWKRFYGFDLVEKEWYENLQYFNTSVLKN